jgi:hypothetical protein
MQLIVSSQRGGETERDRERFSALKVRFLEFEPRDISHLDHGVAGAPAVLAFQGASLAVELVMCADQVVHPDPFHSDEIVTYDAMLSQELLTKSSKLIDTAILSR